MGGAAGQESYLGGGRLYRGGYQCGGIEESGTVLPRKIRQGGRGGFERDDVDGGFYRSLDNIPSRFQVRPHIALS